MCNQNNEQRRKKEFRDNLVKPQEFKSKKRIKKLNNKNRKKK